MNKLFKKLRKNRIISVISFVFSVLILWIPLLAPISASIPHSVSATETNEPASQLNSSNAVINNSCYSTCDVLGHYKKYYPNEDDGGSSYIFASTPADEKIYFYIAFTERLSEDVDVYYHTVNLSAIDGVDYVGVPQGTYVTVHSGELQHKVAIDLLGKAKFSVNDVTRDFNVVIDKAINKSGNEYKLIKKSDNWGRMLEFFGPDGSHHSYQSTSLWNETTCCLNADYSYSTSKQSWEKLFHFSDYAQYVDYSTTFNAKGGETNLINLPFSEQSFYDKYVATGLGNLYASYVETNRGTYNKNKSTNYIDIYLGNLMYNQETNKDPSVVKNLSWWTRWADPKNTNIGKYEDQNKLLKYAKDTVAGKSPVFPLGQDICKFFKWKNSDIVNQSLSSYTCHKLNDPTRQSLTSEWLKIADANSRDKFGVRLLFAPSANVGTKGFTESLSIYSAIFDDINPYVLEDGVYASSYLDLNGKPKIRLSVRFNEPIQNFKNTSITCSSGYPEAPIEFKLLPNQLDGSDTLAYEADLSDEKYTGKIITSLSDFKMNSYGDIADYAQDPCNHMVSTRNLSYAKVKIILDERYPVIDIPGPSQTSSTPKKNVQITASINSCYIGNVYYQFLKETTPGEAPEGPKTVEDYLNTDGINEGLKYNGFVEIDNEESSSSQIGISLPPAENRNGNYYLFIKAVSLLGMETNNTFGPYLIDNTAPKINFEATGNVKERTFNFNVEELNGLDNLKYSIEETSGEVPGSHDQNLKINKVDSSHYSSSTTLTFQDILDRFYQVPNAPTKSYYIQKDSDTFSFQFSATDQAGNETKQIYVMDSSGTLVPTEEKQKFYFSNEDYFACTITPETPSLMTGENLYQTGTKLVFQGDNTITDKKLTISFDDKTYLSTGEYSEAGYTIDAETNNKLVLTFTKPGKYDVKLERDNQFSEIFTLYASDDFKETTNNYAKVYSNELLLTNRVFQLDGDSRLYYLGDVTDSRVYSSYYNGTDAPTFSSVDAAKTFLTAHEYEDLYLIELTPESAAALSGTSSDIYRKAENETTLPVSGQYWIRYKSTSWSLNTQDRSGWRFYYYSDGTSKDRTIDVNNLSINLRNAIEETVKQLVATGETVYLIDPANLNPITGAPMLNSNQIEVSHSFILNNSRTGTTLKNATYNGDSALFSSQISVTKGDKKVSMPLATNYPLDFSNDTIIYIASYNDVELKYIKVSPKENLLLKDAINLQGGIGTSGIYSILEIDNKGASKYEVYIDKSSPIIMAQKNDEEPFKVTGVDLSNHFGMKFSIFQSADNKDTDEFAYVAVYNGSRLINFEYLKSFDNKIQFNDGNYVVQVGDRSGNIYSFKVYVKNDDIKVSTYNGESYFSISVGNREPEELDKFEVYCNGLLLDSKLTTSKTFTQNGFYSYNIVDRYGKSSADSLQFTRKLPEVKIYYYDDNGSMYEYIEGRTEVMIVQPESDHYKISTSKLIRINVDTDKCDFTVSDIDEENYTIVNGNAIVLNKLVPFTLTVNFKDHPEDKIKYICYVDNLPPVISADYETNIIIPDELSVENFDIENNCPKTLSYSYEKGQHRIPVLYGDKINAQYVNFNITDETKVKEVVVTLNGEVVKQITANENNIRQVTFMLDGKDGRYVVKATDLFNQSTSLVFDIKDNKVAVGTIDNVEVSPSTDKLYGNSSVDVNVETGSQVAVLISGIEKGYFLFDVTPQGIYKGSYVVEKDDDGQIAISIAYEENVFAGFPYIPYSDVDLRFSKDDNGNLVVHYNQGDTLTNIQIRAIRKGETVNLYDVDLSKEVTEVKFVDQDGIELKDNDGYIYASEAVRIPNVPEIVSSIKVAYNPTAEQFKDEDFVDFTDDYEFKGRGFYRFVITNKYGNKKYYTVILSNSVMVTVTANYINKPSENFIVDIKDDYYANLSFELTGYNMKSMTTDKGQSGVVSGQKMTLILKDPGVYVVTLIDLNLNMKVITVEIGSEEITYKEDWLIGYNEKAVKKDEGYTNQKLSVNLNEETLKENKIDQIYYVIGDKTVVLYGYDNLIGEIIPYSLERFTDCIGNDGDGIYTVVFANKYGDVTKKEINYSVTPTLSITRITNQSINPESIELDAAIADGVWSNMSISFATTLHNDEYIFLVKNGDKSEYSRENINYPFVLSDITTTGEVYYYVTYTDAYGNEYNIKVNLIRRNLSFPMDHVNTLTVDNALYTKENFYFVYDPNDVSVTYTINGGQETYYASKTVMSSDGTYQFLMFDKAGNKTSLLLVKDSVVKFTVINAEKNTVIPYGGIVNSSNVTFNNLESFPVNIISCKLNGEKYDVVNNLFTKTGKYEFIAEDHIGNLRYFEFTMVNHSLASFTYTAPEPFTFTSAYYTSPEGIKVTCLDKIDKNTNTLHLENVADGVYDMQIKNKYDNSVIEFTIVISHEPPQAVLVGCNEGDTTTNDITLDKLVAGDNIKIYRDGELVREEDATSNNYVMEPITEGGQYKIVVTNLAGVSEELSFNKLTIVNIPTSILIILVLIAISGGFFIGTLLRNKNKTDK